MSAKRRNSSPSGIHTNQNQVLEGAINSNSEAGDGTVNISWGATPARIQFVTSVKGVAEFLAPFHTFSAVPDKKQ
jgi:hypothetical protein